MAYEDEIEAWRGRRLARLVAPDGWLSLAGLAWLREGDNRVGADPSCDVVLPAGAAPALLGSIIVSGGNATATFPPGSGVTADGRPVESIALHHDFDETPTELTVGSLRLRLIRRANALAIRIFDWERADPAAPPDIPHYPVDPTWRLDGRFEPADSIRRVLLPTVVGPGQDYRIVGSVSFRLADTPLTLEAYQELDESDLFLVFGDLTNGDETYPGGRYLYANPPAPEDGFVELDFNRAYNPACVFTPYATCVLAQPTNRLPVRIEAGEKRYPAPT
ncbi:MAG: DUF1684 domain-containing protein [Actinomycetota bacterium]